MAINDKLRINDYNSIQTKVASVLGTGSISYGYGQTLNSSPVTVGTKNSSSKWNDLRNDLYNIYAHILGTTPSLTTVSQGQKTRYGASAPEVQYNTSIDNIMSSRFNVHSSRSKTVNKGTGSAIFPGIYGANWSTKASCVVTYTFSNNNQARYFFNSGGKIRFISSRSGGSTTSQNGSWTNLLSSAGTVEFGAQTSTPKKYYELTDVYQLIHETTSSGIYAYFNNEYRISAKCNVANNSTGTASVLYFLIEWVDAYSGTPGVGDYIDGTLSISSNTLEATGAMVPTGVFTIESPAVSYSSFTIS